MALRGSDRIDGMEMESRDVEVVRPRRPWALIVAALLLVVLSVVLWAKWSESRSEVERLRAELKVVYTEAEAIRTQAALAQQRVAILEKQLGVLREKPAPADATKPIEKPRAKSSTKSKSTQQITR
jgi:type VI protein secretion system component VasK